jgi:hypothetical protein
MSSGSFFLMAIRISFTTEWRSGRQAGKEEYTLYVSTDRWGQIQELYHAALDRHSSNRAEFLSQACPNDPELRRDGESLLAHEGHADDLFEGRRSTLTSETDASSPAR